MRVELLPSRGGAQSRRTQSPLEFGVLSFCRCVRACCATALCASMALVMVVRFERAVGLVHFLGRVLGERRHPRKQYKPACGLRHATTIVLWLAIALPITFLGSMVLRPMVG